MEARYDAAIIGGGVGGLATGALLANAGERVVVLEKGNQLGGRAYTYVDQGFVLNYGAHAMYRVHSGTLAQVLKRLGRPLIPAPYPNPRLAYFALDGRWGRLGTMPHHLLGSSLLPAGSKLTLLSFLGRLRLMDPEKLGEATLGKWLEERVGDPLVRRFVLGLAGVNTYTRPSAGLSARFFVRHLKRTLFARDYVGYMSGGWSTMYDAFAATIRERSGEIVTGAAVERLVVQGGRAVAALANGARYEAGAFVVTTPPQQTPDLAEDGSALRYELERWRGSSDARALCIDLGFSHRLRTDLTFINDIDRDLYFSLHSEVTPDLAPPGGQLLHAMAYLSPEEADDERLRAGRERKLEDGLDRFFPGWREAAVVERRLPRAQVTTIRQTPEQQGSARLPARSSAVPNVYFAGDGRDLPYNLTEVCLAAAMEVADLIVAETPPVARREAVVAST